MPPAASSSLVARDQAHGTVGTGHRRRIPVWGADTDDPEFSFIQQPKQAAPKEKVFQELFEDVDTPYWRLKTIMDAWCALWFWPAEQISLLDGRMASTRSSRALSTQMP